MKEFTPLIRIGLYMLAGWLSSHGLPKEAANIISNDPMMLELATQAVAAGIAIVTMIWWRIAKKLDWAT